MSPCLFRPTLTGWFCSSMKCWQELRRFDELKSQIIELRFFGRPHLRRRRQRPWISPRRRSTESCALPRPGLGTA